MNDRWRHRELLPSYSSKRYRSLVSKHTDRMKDDSTYLCRRKRSAWDSRTSCWLLPALRDNGSYGRFLHQLWFPPTPEGESYVDGSALNAVFTTPSAVHFHLLLPRVSA
jgi:hypothetical protein